MSGTRVYVPCTLTLLRDVVASGGIGPAPFQAHAVTDALRAEYADGADEDWEYVAASAAAEAALGLLADDDPPRRVVLAVDAGSARPLDEEDPTLVSVDEPVPAHRIAAVLVDSEDAGPSVTAAVEQLPVARRGDVEAAAVVERCLEHELGWYATQEIADLLRATGLQE